MNKVILIGRLTKDVDLKYIQEGKAVANFTLAVDRPFKNQQGEKEADFIRIVVWGKQAENCGNYIRKGRLVAVSGRLQTRSYETEDGQRKYITEVVAGEVKFLDRAKESEQSEYDDSIYNPEALEQAEGTPF